MKRIFCLILCVLILISAAGCTDSAESGNATRHTSSYTELRWGIATSDNRLYPVNVSSNVILHIEEALNVHIKFQYYDTLNLVSLAGLLGSSARPDILTIDAGSTLGQFLAGSGNVITADSILNGDGLVNRSAYDMLLAERDGTLYGIPGGIYSNYISSGLPACEGVYVAREFYSAMGSPTVTSFGDIVSLSAQFKNSYAQLCTQAGISGRKQCTPIIFGSMGNGIDTLKRAFGIRDFYNSGTSIKHQLAYAQLQPVFDFLMQTAHLSPWSAALDGAELINAMNGESLFFIGNRQNVENYNLMNLDTQYELLSLPDSGYNGFSYTDSAFGRYQSYVFHSEKEKAASELIRYMISPAGNIAVQYGIENVHWIYSGSGIVRTPAAERQLKSNSVQFREETGIGTFPYLCDFSLLGEIYQTGIAQPDPLIYKRIIRTELYSSAQLQLSQNDEYLFSICQKLTSDSYTDSQKRQLIDSFRQESALRLLRSESSQKELTENFLKLQQFLGNNTFIQ